MPDPREAVYDVLLAKKRRAEQAKREAEEAAIWARYEESNAAAHAAYRPGGRR